MSNNYTTQELRDLEKEINATLDHEKLRLIVDLLNVCIN